MSQIFKSYLGIFLLFLSVAVLIGIVDANLTSDTAGDFHSAVINEIEESNFADSVIAECKTSAENLGYTLEVNPVTNEDGNVVMAEVVLNYDYQIPFLGVKQPHQKVNYAH
ncbi:MAG: hypothetical protein J6B26_01525 [Agathobacter sp.]|nr:hypothetical protein [Agathobacter sp.]MBP3568133.1 hypothetical protein [Lachnospiraceae bacterium]